MADIKKAIAVIGGLAGGIGFTYMLRTMNIWQLSNEMWIGLGVVIALAFGSSLYFMMKSGG